MTTNQLRYQELQETKRSNQARETETHRSNVAQETETNRANVTKESENFRSNVAKETETQRSNLAKELQASKELEEKKRSNLVNEDLTRKLNNSIRYKNYVGGTTGAIKDLTSSAKNVVDAVGSLGPGLAFKN